MPGVRARAAVLICSYYLPLLENILPSFGEQLLPSLCGSEGTTNYRACFPAMGLAPERHMIQASQ